MKSGKKKGLYAAREIPEGATQEEMQYHLYDREQMAKRPDGVGEMRIPGMPDVARRMKQWMEK